MRSTSRSTSSRDRAERIRERVSAVGGARAADRSRNGRHRRAQGGCALTTPVRRPAGARRRVGDRLATRRRTFPRSPSYLVRDSAQLADEIERDRDDPVSARSRAFRRRRSPVTPGRSSSARSQGKLVVALAGRFHMYEGHDVRLAALSRARGSCARREDADRLERGGRRESPAGSRAI